MTARYISMSAWLDLYSIYSWSRSVTNLISNSTTYHRCLFLFRLKNKWLAFSAFLPNEVFLWWFFFYIYNFRSALKTGCMHSKGHQHVWCVIKRTITLDCLLDEVRAGLHHRIVTRMSTVLIAVDESKYAENAFRCKYRSIFLPCHNLT